jgi:ferredoxin-NADP reductase
MTAMTAPLLLTAISLAVLLQVLLVAAFALLRRNNVAQPELPSGTMAVARSGAWPGWRAFRVSRRQYQDAQQTQCSFYLEPVDGAALPPFKPGQFLTFELAIDTQQNLTRCYSISQQPDSQHYRITVKRASAPEQQSELAPGVASSHLHDHVQVGDVLQVKAPSGHFYLQADSQIPAVLIAGGIGITPMMSMLLWSLQAQPGRVVHLFYGVRNSAEQAFKTELEQLAQTHTNFHLHVVYSRPKASDTLGQDHHFTGHVDIGLLKQVLPHGQHQFYVCGSSPMMESLVPALALWGVQRSDLHFEAFGPASVRLPGDADAARAASDSTPVEIHFSKSARSLQWDDQDNNLLDFAERHGITVDSGCRTGSCGSCETRVAQGNVHYLNPPDHDPAPGHCLLCVGKPDGGKLVLVA